MTVYIPIRKALMTICLFLCFISNLASASTDHNYPKSMIFQNLMKDQDIALGEVEAFLEDSDGFMWFGGRNALVRYDGYEFLSVLIEVEEGQSSDKGALSQVVDMIEDSKGQVWVGSRSGLLKYDKDREVLTKPRNADGVVVLGGSINALVETPSGELLVGDYSGFFVLNLKDNSVREFEVTGDSTGTASSIVYDIFEDKEGYYWLGTEAGFSRFDLKNMSFQHHVPFKENPGSKPDNSVWAIEQDAKGELWLGVHKGIYRFNPKTQQYRRFLHDPNDPNTIGGNMTRDILVDSKGFIWTGNDSAGLSLYDEANDRFIHFRQSGQNGSLAYNGIRDIYESRNGDLWVGTYPSGVNYHDRSSAAVSLYTHDPDNANTISHDDVAVTLEDDKGNLWIGVSGGVNYYDRANGTIKRYLHHEGKVPSGSILTGTIDSDGDVWFGTWASGFFRYNKATDRFDQIPFDGSQAGGPQQVRKFLPGASVWGLHEDSQKNLWVGSHQGGLNRYNKKTGEFFNYNSDQADETTLSNQLVWNIYEDSKDRLWVGTASGLNLMDREKGTFKRYVADENKEGTLIHNSILTIFEDSKNRLWFGTDRGVHVYHEESDSFSAFNTKDGFVDNGIRSITEDQKGNLWIGTNNGIVVFNYDTKEVKNYKRYNGEKIGRFSTAGALQTQTGEIVLGGQAGMRIFDVNRMGINEVPPPIVITDFRVFTKSVPINGPDQLLSKVINSTDKIVLDYTKTMFSFTFSGLSYRDPSRNQYAYKLEGFDDNWREVGNQRRALYTNLSAGNYTFRVKASNNDGVWNETGRSIQIVQLPPPWLTWWAKLIYVILVISVIANFIYKQYKKRKLIEEQNRILEAKVSERTAELRVKNNDIQAMLSNMRQGLCTVEPNGEVHQEYSKFMESIFGTDNIAGRNAHDLLFDNANVGSNSLDQVKEAIVSIIGEDEMNYDFNSHLLIDEYETEISEQKKYLQLDWNPIVVDDEVAKLMVSIRDVTQLKEVEKEAESKKRELDIISQLLNVPAKKYKSFTDTAKQFIEENREKIENTEHKDDEVIALLFRNMHTIKGNCRTFGFNYFSDVVHEVESVYSDIKKNEESVWDKKVLLEDLIKVEDILAEYQNVYFTVLGRGENSGSSRDENGFWLDEASIKKIRACVDAAHIDFPELEGKHYLLPVQQVIDKGQSDTVKHVLSDIVSSLPSIAEQLGKRPPAVSIEDANIRIRSEATDLMNNVFAHILRNNVDHGIEPPEERESLGKSAEGAINIRVMEGQSDNVEIHVKDDGRGISIARLYQKGVDIGKWQQGDSPITLDIANLIFESGVSTKEQVTDISGRGVGMDAVRQFLQNNGGNISLNLFERNDENYNDDKNDFAACELVVSLPKRLCIVPVGSGEDKASSQESKSA